MENKVFYRVSNVDSEQGLWYDFEGNFTGLIHDKFDFCLNSELPMPFDPDVVGWLSTTDVFDDLFHWFTKEDITQLETHGYKICVYESTEYREYENHWLIKQDSANLLEFIDIADVNKK